MFRQIPYRFGNTSALLRLAALSLIALAGGFLGFVATHANKSSGAAGDDAEVGTSQLLPQASLVASWEGQGAHIYAIAWDEQSKEVVYVTSIGDRLALHRSSTDGSSATSVELKDFGVNTPHTFIAIHGGVAWVASGYDVAGVASDGTVAFRERLRLEDGDAVAGALDPGGVLPGTWVNGLVANADGDVLLTRHNVKSLFVVSSQGVAKTTSLDSAPDGLVSDGQTTVSFQWNGDELRGLGGAAAAGHLSDVVGQQCGLRTDWASSKLTIRGAQAASNLRFGRHDQVAANGNKVALALESGTLLRVNCGSQQVERFDLPDRRVRGDFADGWGGGSEVTATSMREYPEAVALSQDGTLAFSDTSGRIAVVR